MIGSIYKSSLTTLVQTLIGFNRNLSAPISTRKFVRLLKLSRKIIRSNWTNDDPALKYLRQTLDKTTVSFEIGLESDKGLRTISVIANSSYKAIAFVTRNKDYNELKDFAKLFRLKNLSVELLSFSTNTDSFTDWSLLRNNKFAANVIDLKERIATKKSDLVNSNNIDAYCLKNSVRPDFIKINLPGQELLILKGASNILKDYRPKLMVVCEEKFSGRDDILQTFKFLLDLKYKGSFILDSIRIPLQNFDFDVYQNPNADFYCNHFIFE